jgi:hypothetical protein
LSTPTPTDLHLVDLMIYANDALDTIEEMEAETDA